MLQELNRESEKTRLNINSNKTKVITNLSINGQPVEGVTSYKYLGDKENNICWLGGVWLTLAHPSRRFLV